MTTINLDNIGKVSQKRIRDDNGVKTITSLINLAKEKGVNVGVKKETQQKRAYEYFGNILNNKIEAEREKKIRAEQKKKDDERKKKKEEKRKAINKNVVVDIASKPFNDLDEMQIQTIQQEIIKGLKKVVNKPICYLQLTYTNYKLYENEKVIENKKKHIIRSLMINIKAKNETSIFWENIMPEISVEGSDSYSLLTAGNNVNFKNFRLVITTDDKIPSKQIQQSFRDGETHCVIEPLYNLWKKMSDNSESLASKKRCLQIANKIKGYEKIYENGVPEDKMEEVAQVANRCIVLYDVVGNVIHKYNEKSSKTFNFTNTRKNHVDLGFITMNNKYENVSIDELNQIIKKSQWGLFQGDFRCPTGFNNTEGSYAVYNDDYELFQEFNKELGIKNYSINAVKNKKLNEFIREGRIINSAPVALCDNPNYENMYDDDNYDKDYVNNKTLKHADVEKAYTQHQKCSYYMGFLGKIHQFVKGNFDKKFITEHNGMYKFKVIECNNKLFTKLGLKVGLNYLLPSPEILKMIDSDIKVQIFAGCFGHSFDFEYNDKMLENRNYCIWAGKLGMDNEYNTYSFKGDAEWASHLKHELGEDNVFYFSDMQMIMIRVKKLSYTTNHHILAFITSYTRINMIEMMEAVDGELVKVILDGIYYTGTMGDVNVPFKNKEIKMHLGFGEGWYFPSEINVDDLPEFDERFDGNCVLAGAGGCGKSYSVFNYGGFTDVLYVVPSHFLGGDKHYTTIHRLIGIDCQSYRDMYKLPSVIFIDELTMIESEWIEKAIELYPECQIIIGGDIDKKQWYQCRNGYVGHFSKIWMGKGWRFVEYNNDYRALDNDLKNLKCDVRREMKRIFTGNDIDTTAMKMYIKKRVKVIKFDEAISMTNENDIWIAGTHKTEKMLKDKGILCNYKGTTKSSFTIHSFQGQTIEDQRVFIKLDLFEYAMLYTALSRVRRYEQLIFVD
jgi:hypothetical protein